MARADHDPLYERACALGLHGLCARRGEFGDAPWVPQLIEVEESERRRRSLERRLRSAKIGAVRPMADFDWKHPKKIPRGQVEELFDLRFLDASTPQNVILLGPNGVGKTMIGKNLAHHAVTRGYQVRFTETAAMLSDLSSQDGPAALRRRLHRYIKPALLVRAGASVRPAWAGGWPRERRSWSTTCSRRWSIGSGCSRSGVR